MSNTRTRIVSSLADTIEQPVMRIQTSLAILRQPPFLCLTKGFLGRRNNSMTVATRLVSISCNKTGRQVLPALIGCSRNSSFC